MKGGGRFVSTMRNQKLSIPPEKARRYEKVRGKTFFLAQLSSLVAICADANVDTNDHVL